MKIQRRWGWAALVLTAAVLMTFKTVGASSSETRARAAMSGENTRGRGEASFKVARDGMSIEYHLEAANLNDLVTMAHIHAGTADQNGPIVVWLFPGAPPASPGVEARGRLAEGVITPGSLRGPYAGQWEQFKQDLTTGKLYVNVHTIVNPTGEIRGQVDDRGGRHEPEPGDDRGGRHEPEPGDDRGGHHEPEPGDDRGGRR